MQVEEIEKYLAELGQELQRLGLQHPFRVLLVGGAFMLTQVDSRRTTDDIDVLLKGVDDPTTTPDYRIFKTAARTVANRNGIPVTWVNDLIDDFLREVSIVPEGTLWRTYALLEVYVPPIDYILALKLFAAREKDYKDIARLCEQLQIHTRAHAQRVVDRYIPDKQVQQMQNLNGALNDIFPY